MTMNAKTLITNLQYELGKSGSDWSTESLNTRNGWLNRVTPQLGHYDGDEQKILRNGHLNQAGQTAAIRELGTKFLSTVEWIKNLVTKHSDEDQGFKTRLFDVKSPINDELRRELRNGEVRSHLVGLNQGELDSRFLLAAQHDQDEVLDAMLTSPMGPMVSDDMKQRALDARAQRQQPNNYAAFRQNTLLLGFAQMLQELIARRLYGIGVDAAKIKTTLGIAVASEDEVRQPSMTAEQLVGA